MMAFHVKQKVATKAEPFKLHLYFKYGKDASGLMLLTSNVSVVIGQPYKQW